MVEWKKLGDVCEVITGGEVPENTIKGQMFPTKEHPFAVYTNGKETYGYSDSYQIDSEAVCISSIGANTGAVFYKIGKFTPAIRLKVLIPKSDIITKYLFYISTKIDFRGRNTGSVPNINANYVKSKIIPIPSKSEQERIVSILDTFTASIANLKAQIKERRKQYEYYRDQLLGEIKECNPIKHSCTIIKGTYITKKDTTPGNIPVILGGQEPAYYIDKYNHEGKAIVVSRSGASAGYVSFWNEPIFVTDGFLLEPKSTEFLIEYLFYALKSRQTEIQALKRGAGVPHITTNHINELIIPIPSKEAQLRIVNILDQFEASIANLEAQLKEREKQYEYYRNQLLTFEQT